MLSRPLYEQEKKPWLVMGTKGPRGTQSPSKVDLLQQLISSASRSDHVSTTVLWGVDHHWQFRHQCRLFTNSGVSTKSWYLDGFSTWIWWGKLQESSGPLGSIWRALAGQECRLCRVWAHFLTFLSGCVFVASRSKERHGSLFCSLVLRNKGDGDQICHQPESILGHLLGMWEIYSSDTLNAELILSLL